MAVDVARPPHGAPPASARPSLWARFMDFYHGVIAEMRKVTWPDRAQVRQATVAIIIFVLIIALVITALDYVLSLILVHLIPSLFAGR
jgi:preprotein translocase subunit SecE